MLSVQGRKCVGAEEEEVLFTGDPVFGDQDNRKKVKVSVVLM